MTEESKSGQTRALAAIRIASLWLLAGALLKLFAGTPADLPKNVVDLIGKGNAGLFLKAAVAIELSVVLLVWLKPKLGWFLLAGNYVVFLGVLIGPALAGETDCGCGGSLVSIHPWVMIGIDGSLLAAILLTRPWKNISAGGAPLALAALLVAGCVAAPFLIINTAAVVPAPNLTTDGGTEQPAPTGQPRFVVFEFDTWTGKSIYDADFPLTPHLQENIEELSPDGRWIFWRMTCDHCAKHLRELAASYAGEPLVLIRDHEEKDATEQAAVTILPEGAGVQHAALRKGPSYFMTTPVEMTVSGGEVLMVEENVGADE